LRVKLRNVEVLMSVIRTHQLTKIFPGDIKAVDSIDIQVNEGGIFGFLGPNGAGKTTLMEILCGLRRLDKGKATINDDLRTLILDLKDDTFIELRGGRGNTLFVSNMDVSHGGSGFIGLHMTFHDVFRLTEEFPVAVGTAKSAQEQIRELLAEEEQEIEKVRQPSARLDEPVCRWLSAKSVVALLIWSSRV
jgi:ABC-type branched-subunit amino acid transport system ATPase component